MHQDTEQFLNLKTAPGRLTAEQSAWFLGFSAHEIPVLIAKGLLKPLGHPAHNGQKYFLTKTLEELRRDEKWFAKSSEAIVEYRHYKNRRDVKDVPIIANQSVEELKHRLQKFRSVHNALPHPLTAGRTVSLGLSNTVTFGCCRS